MLKPVKVPLLLFFNSLLILTSAFRTSVFDLEAAESVAKDYKVQSVESGASGKYGYPYRIAPTLTPNIQARSDDDDTNEAVLISARVDKPYGSRVPSVAEDDATLKKIHHKKSKASYAYTAARRHDGEVPEKRFRSYKEPKYRNFDELEADFRPRRMDIDIPYSQYEYRRPIKHSVSPIDPYLTPSAEPGDSFYPLPKAKNYAPSYGHGHSYGAGRYEDPDHYHDHDSYEGPQSSYPSSGNPSSSYSSGGDPSPSYSSGEQYDYNDNYAIKSNEPIIGSIRKRLLDYAGASDLYEGEPDYLRHVARSKYKYGNLGNDYYSYGGPVHRDTYREFPYVESKIMLIKKSRG